MSDDFGTVNVRRGDHAKELEVLRRHRESLVQMLADVDQEIRELELGLPDTPAERPLFTTPDYGEASGAQPGSGPRVLLIIGAALLALALIAWLIWRASSDRPSAPGVVIEETTATGTEPAVTAPDTIAEPPAAAAAALTIKPSSRDYGLVRKGTRVTRQYEVTNDTEEPITINLARSACRCLYYEHAPVIPPKAKESITVTVDGARAKAGTIRETVKVTAKSDPSIGTSFDVIATVR